MPARTKVLLSAQKLRAEHLLTPREAAATARKGFKRASPELAELLKLANLVPTNQELPLMKPKAAWLRGLSPGTYSLQEMISVLPDAVRLDILENADAIPPNLSRHDQELHRCLAAHKRYQTILDARENLGRLIDGTLEPLRLQVNVRRGPHGKLVLQSAEQDWTVTALLSAELDYLSRCAYSKCEKFFYAVRRGQPGCTPEHSDIIRKQRKRKRDKENRELKETRKKKRATTVRKH